MKTLHEVKEKRGQQLIGERIVRLDTGEKLRGKIVRDSYEIQCYATVSLLHESGWQHLSHLPMQHLAIWAFKPSTSEPWAEAMDEDLSALIMVGRVVVE